MIRDVNTLSITGTCLLTAFCVLNTACNDAEVSAKKDENSFAIVIVSNDKEKASINKVLKENAKLKQEIKQLKKDMDKADDTAPDKLEAIVARCEAELKAVQDEETAILKENIGLATELDATKAQRAALNAAAAELRAVFEKELDLARKAKSKLSRNNEYLNR